MTQPTLQAVRAAYSSAAHAADDATAERALMEGHDLARRAFSNAAMPIQERLAIGDAYLTTFDGCDDQGEIAVGVIRELAA